MARDTTDLTPIDSVDDLTLYMKGGEKPKAQFRIGTEHEKFGFYADTLAPVPYEGERGIRSLLEGMQTLSGWEAITDDGRIIGLAGASGQGAISLEPGGQFELSGAPVETIHQTCRESNAHLADVRKVAKGLGIEFLGMGSSPLWTLAETPIMPKSRYDIMRNYMPKVGTRGLDMMFRTCTIQVNLDFADEADMRRKMQIGMKLQPVATALFANSPFTEGKPNGLVSWRSDVWRDVDNQRSGLLPFVFEPGFTYRDYVEWALDVPMYFVMRDGVYHDASGQSFRAFLRGELPGLEGELPTMRDWTDHMTTAFPEVRLKKYLEMRGADGGPWNRLCALPAFWVGLLYDDAALDAAWDLVRDFTRAERHALRDHVPRTALATPFRGHSVRELAIEALKISAAGLRRRDRRNAQDIDEVRFLEPLIELAEAGQTPAERKLELFHGEWHGDIDRVFREFAY